jgi:hypothetical protein
MPDGEWTPALDQVLAKLHNDMAFRQSFIANAESALATFQLTGHERHALVIRQIDYFVALGIVDATSELPPPLRPAGGTAPTTGPRVPQSVLDRLRATIDRLVLRRPPRPPVERPRPRPQPPPGPGPGP